MKAWLAGIVFVSIAGTSALWAKGPEVGLVDNKLSVNAESVSIGRLLQLIDLATGMKSKVPVELASRNISAKFSGLNVADGVRKLFQGQPVDYVLIEGQGIFVTAVSQNIPTESVPYTPQPQAVEQPFIQQDFAPQLPVQPQQQPATIPTPFGPMANPRAQQQPQVNQPFNNQQQNSLFPQSQGFGQPGVQPGVQQQQPFQPGMPTPVPAPNTSPFITPSPFGTPTTPPNNQNNNVFAPFGTPTTPR
jgi:hypothetical protein